MVVTKHECKGKTLVIEADDLGGLDLALRCQWCRGAVPGSMIGVSSTEGPEREIEMALEQAGRLLREMMGVKA